MYLIWRPLRRLWRARSGSLILLVILTGMACKKAAPVRGQTCERVVCLLPSATETLFAIGAGPQVKAVTRFDDFPEKVRKLPKVGGIIDASPEAILAQAPDCVIGTSGLLSGLSTRLESAGARPVEVDYSTIEQVFESTRVLGVATGHKDRAEALIRKLRQGIAKIDQKAKKVRTRQNVLFVTSLHPLYVAGPESFIGRMLNIAGGKNCVKKGKFPLWSMETVIKANPDKIILFQDPCGSLPAEVKKWPVTAAKTGMVMTLCDESVVRPGPRLVHAIQKLYDLIHHVPR